MQSTAAWQKRWAMMWLLLLLLPVAVSEAAHS
jgi:hypothetical protein